MTSSLKNNFAVNAAPSAQARPDLAPLGRIRSEMAKNYSDFVPDYENDPNGMTKERSSDPQSNGLRQSNIAVTQAGYIKTASEDAKAAMRKLETA